MRNVKTSVAVRIWTMLFILGFIPICALAQVEENDDAPALVNDGPTAADGSAYAISSFEVLYIREHAQHPPIEPITMLPVDLGWTHAGYVAPREGLSTVTIAPADAINRGEETYHASAVQQILERIRDHLVELELMGVFVAPDPEQITESGEDLRPNGDTSLRILIATGIVTEVRSLGAGPRVSDDGPIYPADRVNNPAHQRVRDRSPLQRYEEGDPERTDLMKKSTLDRYLFHLSRHPGRRVDASVAASQEVGGVALDYIVTENPPLTFYAQISNTGTRSTDYWRQRFGFFHTQLTDTDDVLNGDFTTSWFDETNAVSGSYERPFENDRIRWRVHANWSEFTADQVGFFGDTFEGESWAIGGDIIANIHQNRELFIDAVGGIRFQNIQVDNNVLLVSGDENFVIPNIGLQLEHTGEWYSTQASAGLEWWLSDATSAELETLGRTAPDTDPTIFKGSISHALYLEPLVNREAWEDPSTPETSTLAHEMLFMLRGQHSFGDRLIPQAEHVVGGLYTVRGYPESVVAGDSAVIGTIEYRYHVPRAFGIESEPRELFGQTFRRAPQYVYGVPDWDLILKAFVDAGKTYNADKLGFEVDETLVGAGIGFELLYRRNLNIRVDWGFVLEEIAAGNVNDGSNRLHFVATLFF